MSYAWPSGLTANTIQISRPVDDVRDPRRRCHSRRRASAGSGASSRGSWLVGVVAARRCTPRARPRRCATLSLTPWRPTARGPGSSRRSRTIRRSTGGRPRPPRPHRPARRGCGSLASRPGSRRGGGGGAGEREARGDEHQGRGRRPGAACAASLRDAAHPPAMPRASRWRRWPLRPHRRRTRLARNVSAESARRPISPARLHGRAHRMTAERIKITYATLRNDNEELHAAVRGRAGAGEGAAGRRSTATSSTARSATATARSRSARRSTPTSSSGRSRRAPGQDVQDAIAAARRAQPAWFRLGWERRLEILQGAPRS